MVLLYCTPTLNFSFTCRLTFRSTAHSTVHSFNCIVMCVYLKINSCQIRNYVVSSSCKCEIVVAAELRFCALLHIDSLKCAITHCPVYSIFLTVCVHNKQLHFKADRDLFVLMRFSEQHEHRINVWQARQE